MSIPILSQNLSQEPIYSWPGRMLPQFRANGSEVLTFHRYVRLPERYLLMENMSLPQQNNRPQKNVFSESFWVHYHVTIKHGNGQFPNQFDFVPMNMSIDCGAFQATRIHQIFEPGPKLVISWLNSKPLQLQMFFRYIIYILYIYSYIYIYIYTYHISYINPSDFSLTYKSIDDHTSKINPHVGWWHTHFCGWNPWTPTSFSPMGAHRAPIMKIQVLMEAMSTGESDLAVENYICQWVDRQKSFIKCVIFHSSRKGHERTV